MTEYEGFESIILTGDQINTLFQNHKVYEKGEDGEMVPSSLGCLENEYMYALDEKGNEVGIFKYKGLGEGGEPFFEQTPFIQINNEMVGKVRPRNTQQKMAMDLLMDDKTTIKVLTGKFGTGKDFLMSAAAVDLMKKQKFDRIVYVRNNIEVKNSKPIGFLPGSSDNKLLPFAMPLADNLGGVEALEIMMDQGLIEVTHLGFIRGRNIKNSLILCSECENMTKEHIQLLIGRVGEGSALWLNGDFKQCDGKVFEDNNGLLRVIDKLKGHPRFGYVKLLKTERSETAAMADLLD